MAIHVAEDPAEALFLKKGEGPFCDLLLRLGISLEEFRAPGSSPVGYLNDLRVLDENTILIHANDLDDCDVECIVASGASVVFCPGTHRFFDRPLHPLPRLLNAGVSVGLGTDSAVSNSGLSMAAEVRQVREYFPELDAKTVFSLGTGKLLQRFFPGAGSIEVGEMADLAVARVGESRAKSGKESPMEAFLQGETVNVLTMAAGEVVFRREQ